MEGPTGLRILYVAAMRPGEYGTFRSWTLKRLGHTLFLLNPANFLGGASPLMQKIRYRLQMGASVNRLNQAVLDMARENDVDMVWFDKPVFIQTATLRRLRAAGIGTLDYMIDNPYGPRNDPGWRLYKKNIPEYDLHMQQRDSSVKDYLERGAKRVLKIQTAFEPTMHFPPPAGWSDKDRTRGVSFVGTPYDDRVNFLTRLWSEAGLPVTVSGSEWQKRFSPEACAAIFRDGELYADQYREAIWKSKINLSFLTHSNQDEFVHKSFEIAACGGFLLAERSPGHMERFREGEEAVFFTGFDECVAQIRRYLPDEAARARIAAAGRERAVNSGYDNDTQVAKGIAAMREILPEVRRLATTKL